MNSHRQKRPQQRGGQQQGSQEQERMQQLLSRMQSALQLGLRPTPSQNAGGKKWYNTDAEIQMQAARAILAFVSALSSYSARIPLSQVAVEESVAALEGLLGAERETVNSKAADAAARLVSTMGDGLLGYGSERLVRPLALLLNCTKSSTASSAAIALHGIIAKVKPRGDWKGPEDGIWKILEEMDALNTIMNVTQMDSGTTAKDAAFMDLLAIVLERWPGSRYKVGCAQLFLATLHLRCMSSNVGVSRGALRALTATAFCGCAASLILQDPSNIWSTISCCLGGSKPLVLQLEALRLLTTLCKIPSFGASFTGPHIEGIAAGCSRILGPTTCGETRWSNEVEMLVVEAAHATSSVLSHPGSHHIAFLRNGVDNSVFHALAGLNSKRDIVDELYNHQQPQVLVDDRQTRGSKLNPRLRPLLWEILGWLGAHCSTEMVLSASETSRHLCLTRKLPNLACSALSKALRRRGQNLSWVASLETQLKNTDPQGQANKGEQPMNASEVVQICKAVLLLLSSPSHAIASNTKLCLEDAIAEHGIDWLPSLLKTLALAGSNSIKIDHVQTMTNLLTLACVSEIEFCREQFAWFKALKVVLEITKAHVDDMDMIKTERLSVMCATVHSVGVKPCCIDLESWEGCDSVLFSSLWTLFRLLKGSDWAKEVRESITEHMVDNSNWDQIKDGDTLNLLWKLAGDRCKAAGVRWWAVCCLACFGVYGFPSIMGKDMKKTFDNPASSDVIFCLSDGSQFCAHAVVLAVRCESLLPTNFQTEPNGNLVESQIGISAMPDCNDFVQKSRDLVSTVRPDPTVVHLSHRLTSSSFKKLLEFVYSGVVYIPVALVPEMKLVAKRCRMEPLASLLQGRTPVWGQPSAPCDLALALRHNGFHLTNIVLQSDKPQTKDRAQKICKACNMTVDHVHSHRLVLSARCEYFQALFRSGMRDSGQEEIKLSASTDTILKLLLYLYSAELKEQVVDCSWRSLEMKFQLSLLESLVDLAELAGQLVLEELQQLTWSLIGAYLDQNVHLCPAILSLAADKLQWPLVELCATSLAPSYPQLRDAGALDDLHEELRDLVRAAHVNLFMSSG